MRKIFLFFLCCLLCISPVFADDGLSDDSEPVQVDNPSTTPIVVDITQLLNQNKEDEVKDTDPEEVVVLEPQLMSVEVRQERSTAADTNGFKSVILGLIGDYETTVTDYTYNNGNYISHTIDIEPDYAWVCTLGIFGILLWCTFRTIGGICARW